MPGNSRSRSHRVKSSVRFFRHSRHMAEIRRSEQLRGDTTLLERLIDLDRNNNLRRDD